MKKLLLTMLSVLLVSVLFLLMRTGKEMPGGLQMQGGSFVEGVKIVHRQDGTLDWVLTAERADFLDDGEKAALRNVTLQLQKDGLMLHTDSGVYKLSERSFAADDVVEAKGKDYTITANSIDYEVSSGQIRTDGHIKVQGKAFSVEGKGMRADEQQKVRILDDVTATFHK
jgi:lipopolysaccharide export system protein LptC